MTDEDLIHRKHEQCLNRDITKFVTINNRVIIRLQSAFNNVSYCLAWDELNL